MGLYEEIMAERKQQRKGEFNYETQKKTVKKAEKKYSKALNEEYQKQNVFNLPQRQNNILLPTTKEQRQQNNNFFENNMSIVNKNKLKKAQTNVKQLKDVLDEEQNKFKYARYLHDVDTVGNEKTSLYDKTLGVIERGLRDLGSTLATDKYKYKDEYGNTIYLPNRAEIKQQKVRQDYDTGIGRFLGDVGYNTSKIVGSTALNTIAPGAGSTLYWTDMAGDNYKNTINQGYSADRAVAYSLVNTGLEYLTGKALGGATGKLTGGSARELDNALSNVMFKVSKNPTLSRILGTGGSEFVEEFSQEYFDNISRMLILGDDIDLSDKKILEDALYSGLVGFASGGAVESMNGSDATRNIKMFETFKEQIEERKSNTSNEDEKAHYDSIISNIDKYLEKPFSIDEKVIENTQQQIANLPTIENTNTTDTTSNALQNLETFKENQRMIQAQQLEEESNKKIAAMEQELEELKKKMPEVNTEGMNLQESLKAAGKDVNDSVWRSIEELGRKTGIKVIADESYFNDISEASLYIKDSDGNRIMVFNPNADKNTIIQASAIHELTHDLMSSDKKKRALLGVKKDQEIADSDIMRYVESLEGYAEARADLESNYSKIRDKNGNLIYDPNSQNFKALIDEEVVAKILERNLGTQEYVNRLVYSKPNLAQRIYEWVKNKIVNRGGKVRDEDLFWRNVANRFEKAYNMEYNNSTNEASTRYKATPKNNPYGHVKEFLKLTGKQQKEAHRIISPVASRLAGIEEAYSATDINGTTFKFEIFEDGNYRVFEVIKLRNNSKEVANETNPSENSQYSMANTKQQRNNSSNNNRSNRNNGTSQQDVKIPTREQIKSQNRIPNQTQQRNNRELDSSFSYETRLSKETKQWDEFLDKNLTTDNEGRELTKQQQEFFKDSKARDSQGRLITLYHGTQDYDFNEFMGGTFLTDDYMNADGYAYGERVIEAYANIKNPLVIECNGAKWDNLDTPYGTSTREIASGLDESKYDGIIFKNINDNWIDDEEAGYPGDVYYVPNSNQIKEVDNENPTSNPDIRYSKEAKEWDEFVDKNVKPTGTTGTLMAIHNLSEDKLMGVLDLGGFPVPSIAITNPDLVDHNEFGKYSAIFKKDTIDPKNRKNEIYDRDVWSPTFPRIEYEANEKILDDIRKSLKLDYKNEQDSIQRKAILDLYTDRIENLLDSGDLERVRDEIKNNKDIQYSYLKEKGLIEPIYKQVEYNSRFSNDMLKQFLEQYQGSTDFSWNTPLNELSYEQTMALGKTIQRIVKPFYDEEINRIENSKDVPEQSKESMINTWKEKYNDIPNNYGTITDFIYSANRMNNNGIDATEIDEYATLDKTKDVLNKEEYDKWVDDTFNENLINDKGIRNDKDRYTPSGNARSFKATHNPVNLETLVKALSRGNTKGGQEMSIFGTGFGRISAQTANRFNSIKDIKANENRLMSREEASKIIEPLANKLYADTEELAKYYNPREYKSDIVANMQAMDNTSQVIEEFASKNLTSDNLKKTLSDWGYNTYNIDKIPQSVIDNIIDDLNQAKQLPTDYFEAKPQRAVGLDEVEALVIPNDAKESTRKAIRDAGIDFVEYDPNVEGDRNRVINKFDNLKFSKTAPGAWQDFVNKHFEPKGTTTKLGDIKLPTKEIPKKELNLPKNPTKESTYDDFKEYKKAKKEVREELKQEMGITLDDIAVGKDINALGYQRTDPIRLNEKVFGTKVGQKINDATINKTKHNEAERTRFLNKEREEIKNLGIKARSKESAAVQKYGEKQYVNDNGEVSKYGDRELASEFPDVKTQEKIKHAAQVLRNKYDNYIEQINNVITELGYDPIPKRPDYMRHFQEINDKLSQWGIPLNPTDLSKDALPTDINGLTDQFKPGKNWFASAMQRKGFKTTYDAITGIDGYLEGASNLIYHTPDIQRYRALSKMIRDTYGQTHGMDNIDPSTEEGQKRLNDIFDNKLSKYAAWLDEQANALAGKKGGIDRAAERLLGRKIYSVLDAAKKQVGSNMTGFNVRSAMTNFASAVQGASKTKKLAFVKGTMSTIKNIIHKDNLIDKSDFLTSRFGSDQLSKKAWQKASNAGQIFMTGTDYFTANQIWRSKYYENLDKGMSESQAIKKADDFAARIMGDRSKGSTAEAFNSKTLGLLTQFQLEVNNQWSSIIHDNKIDIKSGNKSGATVMFQLGQLAALSYLFNNFMKSMTGSDVMIDPIDMLKKIIGDGDDDDEETIEDRAKKVMGDLVDDLPFVSFMTGGRIPMKEAFKGVESLAGYYTGATDSYGNPIKWSDVKKDLAESAFYWLLPTGYGQVKKTKKGLSMYDKNLPIPGSYTDSGNLRFNADTSTGGKVKAALFGQYSSEESQKYIESGYKSIRKERLEEMKELDMKASEYRKYREDLNKAGTKNSEKIEFIANSDYSDKAKDIMAKNVLNKDFDINEYEKYDSYEEYDYAQKYPEKYSVIKYIAPYDKYNTYKDKIKNIRDNTTNDKAETIKYINGLNMSIPQKAMFIKQYYKSFKSYDKQIIEYINSQKLTRNEKEQILTQLGFTIRNGRVY